MRPLLLRRIGDDSQFSAKLAAVISFIDQIEYHLIRYSG